MVRKNIMCGNCGRMGHEKKSCYDPITSYGLICLKFNIDDSIRDKLINKFTVTGKPTTKISSQRDSNFFYFHNKTIKIDMTLGCHKPPVFRIFTEEDEAKLFYYKDCIKFLMIERKHSLGFLEFIKGNYNIYTFDSIKKLFRQMTQYEIDIIGVNSYEDLVYPLFNNDNEEKETVLNKLFQHPKYGHKYQLARDKFNKLKYCNEYENYLELDTYVSNIKPKWDIKEWGFPKGKKYINQESIINCAQREFFEETGVDSSNYTVLNTLNTIEENLIGTNDIPYKHTYHLAIANKEFNLQPENGDFYETGDLRWMTYDEAMKAIRPYHQDRKRLLSCIYTFFMNNLIHLK